MTNYERILTDMSDEELIRERDEWNRKLPELFQASSANYDTGATIVKEIERILNQREHEGPPWLD